MDKPAASSEAMGSDALFGQHYQELRRIAHGRMRQSGNLTLIDTTSLVNEAYVKLSTAERQRFHSREHFLAYASTAMRSIVIDFARARAADRRGGDVSDITLDSVMEERLPGKYGSKAWMEKETRSCDRWCRIYRICACA